MQNRSFQAYPITLYSNLAKYKVNWNPNISMWELRSAQGCRLNNARDKTSDDAGAIANFIHTELKKSAICLEDIQSYIETFHLIEGDSK